MIDVLLDALLDSAKVLAVVFLFNLLLSFFEEKLSKSISRNNRWSPLIGATFGLIPQCGFSVVASDMYLKRHITMGTLLAVFIACSDEALPIFLSHPSKAIMVLPLLGIKFVLAFIVGFTVDLLAYKKKKVVEDHHDDCTHEETIHTGCCHHDIDNHHENGWHRHLVHPLLHSIKIFLYVLAINLLFGLLLYYVGEDNVMSFLASNELLAPLFAAFVGLIPNCASSVILTNLYLLNGISFGACLAGLIVNAGLGTIYLFKDKGHRKEAFIICGILLGVALVVGYLYMIIF